MFWKSEGFPRLGKAKSFSSVLEIHARISNNSAEHHSADCFGYKLKKK